jgi:TatD DNase family protein
MRFVDFHCHLDLYPNPAAAIAEAEAAKVYTLTVTTTPRAWRQNLGLTRLAKYVRPALGLHPQLVADHAQEIGLWEEYLSEARYIGEVGIDAGPRFYHSLDLQKQLFERILRLCATAGGKILSVHSVRSVKAVLDLIEASLPPSRGKVVLHWFTGSKSEARRAIGLGCYFSVNNAMLVSERGRSLVSEIPSERLLTETDGPFTSVNSRPSRPSDVAMLVEQLASERSTSPSELATIVISNLRTLVETVGESLGAEGG